MRELTRFDTRPQAETLGDALLVEEIENEVSEARDGSFVIWVYEEKAMEAARRILADFEANPDAALFTSATAKAQGMRPEQARQESRTRHRVVRVRDQWEMRLGVGRVTGFLILVSIATALLSRLGQNHEVLRHLSFASYEVVGDNIVWPYLSDIRSGQVWRIFTPIFIHFGLLHLVFNLLWTRELGTQIELRQAPWFLALMVAVIAAISNSAQYFASGSPAFGGMSGVVYGLFGYIWIRGRFDPASGYHVARSTVQLMIGWFLLCFTGWVGPIANAAHGAGLLAGALWGYVAALRRP